MKTCPRCHRPGVVEDLPAGDATDRSGVGRVEAQFCAFCGVRLEVLGKFSVHVIRTSYADADIVVEAYGAEEARELAEKKAYDTEMKDYEHEYEVESVREVL